MARASWNRAGFRTMVIVLAGVLAAPAAGQLTLYVDDDAPPGGDGRSWETAYRFLQDAVTDARAGGVNEIRIAQGVYVPDRDEQHPEGTGDRFATFRFNGLDGADDVTLVGGYLGLGAGKGEDPDERDFERYVTILSGDLDGDDGPAFSNNDENCYTVVWSSYLVLGIDGVIVERGNNTRVPGRGGGVLADNGTVLVCNTTFRSNFVEREGAGLLSWNNDAVLVNCRFIGNHANPPFGGTHGGGFHIRRGNVTMLNCSFFGNIAGDRGGGAYCGGGVYLGVPGDEEFAFVANCVFSGNEASQGGGLRLDLESVVINCSFSGNRAGNIGGGLLVNVATSVLHDCVVWGNSAFTATQIWHRQGVTVNYSCVEDGWDGPGVGNIATDPRFANPDGPDDIFGTEDDDLRILWNSPCIDAGDNLAVPADTEDLDGDGDTDEPIPLDIALNERFVDDPIVADTGQGMPPIVDMGAYESSFIRAGMPGVRLWTDPAGGVFLDAGNWIPDVPGAADTAVFDLDGTFEVVFGADVGTDRLVIAQGDLDFRLDGGTYALTAAEESVLVGAYPVGSTAALTVRDGTLAATFISVHDDGGGVLAVGRDVADGVVEVEELLLDGGLLRGNTEVRGQVANVGVVDPGFTSTTPETLTIVGSYEQARELAGGRRAVGELIIDFLAAGPPHAHDRLAVTGAAALGGGLRGQWPDGFDPDVGTEFEIMSAETIAGAFDVALFPGLPGEKFMNVVYERGPAPGSATVRLVVEDLQRLFGFGDPRFFGLSGVPSAVAVGDFDRINGVDVALTLPAADPDDPGAVVVLLNAGSADGEWLGFGSQALTTVGPEPSAITVALLDGDDDLDVAVTNAGDDTISVLINDGLGQGTFGVTDVPVGRVPLAITAGDLVAGGGGVDLAVANSMDDSVWILRNDGNGLFDVEQVMQVGRLPTSIDAEDIEDPKNEYGLFVGNRLDDTISVLTPSGGVFQEIATVGTDQAPVALASGDFDLNGFVDVAVANEVGGTVSVVLNDGPGEEGRPEFRPAVDLPVGTGPRSITAVDLEGDGDLDIAVVAADQFEMPVVQVLRNDLLEGQLIFAQAETFEAGVEPVLVTNGDLDGDGQPDLIAVTATGGASPGGSPALDVRLNLGCPADLDDDRNVGFEDLLIVLALWGPYEPCPPLLPADLDGDCSVGFGDLLRMLAEWGACD